MGLPAMTRDIRISNSGGGAPGAAALASPVAGLAAHSAARRQGGLSEGPMPAGPHLTSGDGTGGQLAQLVRNQRVAEFTARYGYATATLGGAILARIRPPRSAPGLRHRDSSASCAGVRAPTTTEATAGWARSQASATSEAGRPRRGRYR